jgi:undecaprenyl pyrophosphate phosphatase UppP
MVIFPLVAAGVSAIFATALFLQYAHRKRFQQFAWGIALALYAVASLAVAGGVANGWDPTLYKAYWLFGAMLNVPWLALGSIALLGRTPLTVAAGAAVLAGTVWGFARVLPAHPAIADPAVLPRGHDAWAAEGSIRSLASYYSYPAYAVVVAIALWTSRKRKGYTPPRSRVRGNWLIAIGVTIVAVGGTALARLASGSVFSVSLAVGVAVMYVGFLLASRAPRFTVEQPGDEAT